MRHTKDIKVSSWQDESENVKARTYSLPRLPLCQFDKTQRRQDIRQRTSTRSAHKLKDDTQVARDQTDHHSRKNKRRGKYEMAIGIELLMREIIFRHDLPADEGLQGQCSEHVEAKAETGHVDHDVVGWEIVEHVSLGEGAKV